MGSTGTKDNSAAPPRMPVTGSNSRVLIDAVLIDAVLTDSALTAAATA